MGIYTNAKLNNKGYAFWYLIIGFAEAFAQLISFLPNLPDIFRVLDSSLNQNPSFSHPSNYSNMPNILSGCINLPTSNPLVFILG